MEAWSEPWGIDCAVSESRNAVLLWLLAAYAVQSFCCFFCETFKGIAADAESMVEETHEQDSGRIGFGLVLGALDGATAGFYPETRSLLGGIMVGSSIKGMMVGLLSGWFARKVQSTKWGIVVGSAFGLLFAFLVAARIQ